MNVPWMQMALQLSQEPALSTVEKEPGATAMRENQPKEQMQFATNTVLQTPAAGSSLRRTWCTRFADAIRRCRARRLDECSGFAGAPRLARSGV